MAAVHDFFPPLSSADRLHELQLPDVNLEAERRHRVTRRWRCSCGHTETAQDQSTLRALAIAHHAERHANGMHQEAQCGESRQESHAGGRQSEPRTTPESLRLPGRAGTQLEEVRARSCGHNTRGPLSTDTRPPIEMEIDAPCRLPHGKCVGAESAAAPQVRRQS